ncbi:alpha/beta hydrolase [Streptacidiphilus sp. ASG 303]|uniref:alpha/beta hydrolase family protein n=1 Tax=Streptacidiphilus sp. ASG 303 TaxID=2896847 RepID=UPI001E3C001D|nr:alpha/beta fold hydrolase [Streptacidiphilus sp. ASG 303]MCD0483248.1 alpha/beta hydrolase [Streptacidiphilus sp. ASG 303]
MRELPLPFACGGRRLSGTLALPDGPGPHPAVLLLPGSGPVDRDSDHRRMPLGVTRLLAHALAGAGLASLRYDKRGVGASPGDWRRAGLHDNVDDAQAALAALAARGEVDAGRLLLLGHSEGAVLATALAGRGADVAGLGLLCGAARPGEEVLRWQARRIAPTLPAPVRAVLRLLRTDLEARVAANHARVRATTGDTARIGGVRLNARWVREYLAYDPAADLARVRVPVLAVTGEKDLQVDPDDLAVIAGLVRGPVETHRLPDVTHTLRARSGPPSLRAYRREARLPLDPRVTALVTGWAVRTAGGGAGR